MNSEARVKHGTIKAAEKGLWKGVLVETEDGAFFIIIGKKEGLKLADDLARQYE